MQMEVLVHTALISPAVQINTLKQIMEWQKGGAEEEDIVDRLRARTVPPGFVPNSWIPGTHT